MELTDPADIESYIAKAVESAKIFHERSCYDLEAKAICLQADLHHKFNQLLLSNEYD